MTERLDCPWRKGLCCHNVSECLRYQPGANHNTSWESAMYRPGKERSGSPTRATARPSHMSRRERSAGRERRGGPASPGILLVCPAPKGFAMERVETAWASIENVS